MTIDLNILLDLTGEWRSSVLQWLKCSNLPQVGDVLWPNGMAPQNSAENYRLISAVKHTLSEAIKTYFASELRREALRDKPHLAQTQSLDTEKD